MPVLPNRRYAQWSPPGAALVGPLPEDPEARRQAVADRLLELSRVALAVIDIEAARDCLLPAAHVAVSDDDFGYHIDLCNAVKKGLLRLERLTDLDVATAIWQLRPDQPGSAHLVLAGSTYTGQLVSWDKYTLPLPDPMRQAFDGAPGLLFSDDGRWCSVFAPLRDSLDDIVAVLEVCAARLPSDPFI